MAWNQAPKTPFKAPTKVTQWLVLLAVLVVCFALSYLVGEARGWVMGTAIGVFVLFALLARPLWKEAWFWSVVAAFGAVHVAGILTLDWSWVTEQRSGFKALGALVIPDVSIMATITHWIFRIKYGAPAESIEPSIDDLPSYGDRNLDF